MTRVRNRKTRQMVLAEGEQLDPTLFPDNLELFLPNGSPIDLASNASKMLWAGEWIGDKAYSVADVVSYSGSLYIAPGDIGAGVLPGTIPDNPDIQSNRGVMFKASDRLYNVIPKEFVIGPSGQRRDNDINSGYNAVMLLDKIGVTTDMTLTVTPLSISEPTESMTLVGYTAAEALDFSVYATWDADEVAAHVSKTVSISNNADDRYIHVFFGNGIDGSFAAVLNNNVNLLAPPPIDVLWEKLLDFTAVEGLVPAGGTTGYYLSKATLDDYDTEWVPAPEGGGSGGVPAGGAVGYLLAKASSTDYDTEWVPAPSGGGGSGVVVLHSDDFSDPATLSGYTAVNGTSLTGASISGGLLGTTATNLNFIKTGVLFEKGVQAIKIIPQSDFIVELMLKYIDATHYVFAQWMGRGNMMYIYELIGTTFTQRSAVSFGVNSGEPLWLIARFDGNRFIQEARLLDPRLGGTPDNIARTSLLGLSTFGVGTFGNPGLRLGGWNGSSVIANTVKIDEWIVAESDPF